PQLPLAQNPDTMTEQRFGRLEARLERRTWQRLKERAAEFGLTPSSVLLTAYAETLGAWSRSNRFTINLTQFNRLPLHPEVNAIVGDFTTLTLLAVELGTGTSLLERGRNLQQQLAVLLDHLVIEPHLRRLGNVVHELAQPFSTATAARAKSGHDDRAALRPSGSAAG
ncbi:hypothetical protein ACEQ6C_38180, partial [Rhizobium ruizarguesonis]